MAELMVKSIRPEALLAPFTRGDYERLRWYVRGLGGLDESYALDTRSARALLSTTIASSPVMKHPMDVSDHLV